jgi:hypothetical protein
MGGLMKIWQVAAAALIMSATPAVAGTQDFTVINGTGKTIQNIYVSESAKDNWEEDVLDQDTLANGQRFEIAFDRSSKACLWDLKVTYDTGRSATWNAIDLCRVSVVALRYDPATGKTFARKE